MKIKKWNELPIELQVQEVQKYYNILSKKNLQLTLKRFFDLSLGLCLLILLSPIIFLVSFIVKMDSKGPVFFRQTRITQYGKKFTIIKFRTMFTNSSITTSEITAKEDCRITKLGRLLRKYRIDEIPQLFNVITGDMSFVGTRPEVEKYVASYTNEMLSTLLLPAGITSISSIRFKDENELLHHNYDLDKVYVDQILPCKMKYNIEYLENFSFLRDIKIIFLTIGFIFFHK